MRLVSLLPSATEIVYALGLGDDLAGVTFECDEPPAARAEKTIVVGGLDTSAMAPGDIDRYVRSRLAAGQDLYTLHARALAALAPDLILTQDLCRVCALPSGHVNEALDYLGCHADVLTLDPHSLAEVLDSIATVGHRAGVPERAAALVAGLHERLAAVAARGAGLGRPRVAVVEWVDPPFTAGHWVPDLVTAAGGQPVAARPGMPSVETTWADLRAAEPELVVVAPCGYHLAGAAEQALVVARALPGVPVWAIDADGIVVRPGPRLVNGVEALAAVIHPQAGPAAPPGTVQRVRLRACDGRRLADRGDDGVAAWVGAHRDAGGIDPGDQLLGEDRVRPPGGLDFAVHEQHQVVGVLAGLGEVVQGGNHGHAAAAAQAVDELEDLLLVPDVEQRSGLVQQQDPRILGQGAGQDRPLAFPAGQAGEPPACEAGDIQPVAGLGDLPPVEAARSTEVTQMRSAAEQDVLLDGHVRRQHRDLRHVGDEAGPGAAAQRAEVFLVDADRAAVRHQAGHRAQQRGLARSVRPDQGEPAARGHGTGHRVQHRNMVEFHAEVVDTQGTHVRTAAVERRIQMNTGEPTRAVTTPMGSSAGDTTVRARVSARTRKPAPTSSDSGSTRR